MDDRPFRSPAISHGYPLDADERQRVKSAAHSTRWVVSDKKGSWEVRREGAFRASARADTQQEAVQRGRDIVKQAGGGELIVRGRDGRIRDRDTIRPSRTGS